MKIDLDVLLQNVKKEAELIKQRKEDLLRAIELVITNSQLNDKDAQTVIDIIKNLKD